MRQDHAFNRSREILVDAEAGVLFRSCGVMESNATVKVDVVTRCCGGKGGPKLEKVEVMG